MALVLGKLLGDGPGDGPSSVRELAGATAADTDTAALVRAIVADRSGSVEFDEFSRFNWRSAQPPGMYTSCQWLVQWLVQKPEDRNCAFACNFSFLEAVSLIFHADFYFR